jgi:DNA-binding protein HU-beta
MKKLNKRDLVEMVAEEAHLSKKDARDAIDVMIELMQKALLNGEEVNLTNFGVFTPKVRAARDGTHPKKHTKITISESRSITFRLAKSFKADLNK